MIKKWKVTPVSTSKVVREDGGYTIQTKNMVTPTPYQKPTTVIRPVPNRQRSFETSDLYYPRINSSAKTSIGLLVEDSPNRHVVSTETFDVRPPKPRRHTTGASKQTLEDIELAKAINEAAMNGTQLTNEFGQEIDPNTTLGRKQLISMLKQRYGTEIENYKSSPERASKEEARRERQKERDLRHEQKKEMFKNSSNNQFSPTVKISSRGRTTNGIRQSSESSDFSEDSSNSPTVQRVKVTASYQQNLRNRFSDDESARMNQRVQSSDEGSERNGKITKAVVFLQYADEVKRVNLPPNFNSLDSIKVLFVNAFPGKLSMAYFENGSKLIYIKDMESGVYYHLEDFSEVVNRSFLKIHEVESKSMSPVNFAEVGYPGSLQEIPRLKRFDSGNSLRSDIVTTKSSPRHPMTSRDHITAFSDDEQIIRKRDAERVPEREQIKWKEVKEEKKYAPPIQRGRRKTEIEEQLEDLSDLLTDVIENDRSKPERYDYSPDTKNPGKLDQKLINNLEKQSEISRKRSLPKHFQPTVLVKAQEEHERHGTPIENGRDHPVTRVTTSYNYHQPILSEDLKRNGENNKSISKKTDNAMLASQQSSPNKYISTTIRPTDQVDGHDDDDLALDLMDQLLDLEEEVKKVTTASMTSSSHDSRRSSASSSDQKIRASKENITMSAAPDRRNESFEDLNKNRSMSKTSRSSDSDSPQYSQINKIKPRTFSTNSKKQTTFGAVTDVIESEELIEELKRGSNEEVFHRNDSNEKISLNRRPELCHPPSVTTPDFIELEDTANNLRNNLSGIRLDLKKMRESHLEGARVFKADLQKKLLEFRKKAARTEEIVQTRIEQNNTFVFANEHPVRERRHRLTNDQTDYNRRMADTREKMKKLEGRMESMRLEVVDKKRVDDPERLDQLHSNLTELTKGLAEIKNKFHGLHDMLKVVAKSEMDVIKREERFIKTEPANLETLIQRCKTLSSTLFTLEKLASVQSDHANNNVVTSPKGNHHNEFNNKTMTSSKLYEPPEYQEIDNSFCVSDFCIKND